MLEFLTRSPWADRIGWVLVHSLWQFVLVALLVVVLQLALQRRSAATRYWALLTAMLVMVAAPVATWFSPWSADGPVAAAKPGQVEKPEKVSLPRRVSPSQRGDDAVALAAVPTESAVELAAQPQSEPRHLTPVPTGIAASLSLVQRRVQAWLPEIVLVWFAGVLLAALRPLFSWYTVRRLKTVGVSPVGDMVQKVLERTAKRLRLVQAVEVLQSTLVKTPVVVGYFRPAVLLPLCIVTGLPEVQLGLILAHELAHIRRHDYLVNLLQTLVETLFFYHPAVWWLSRQIRNERENCCDDMAIATVGSRADYGRALLAIEELRATSPSLSLAAHGGSLLARIRRITGCEPAPRLAGGGSVLCVILVSIAIFAAVTWAAAPTAEQPERLPQTTPKLLGTTPAATRDHNTALSPRANGPLSKTTDSPSAASIIQTLYEGHAWIGTARSFRLRTNCKTTQSEAEIRWQRKQPIRQPFGLDKVDPRPYCYEEEWAWDEGHILQRTKGHNEGDANWHSYTQLWDGSLAIAYGESSDHKQYVLGNKAGQFFEHMVTNTFSLPWGPNDGYSLWWCPTDLAKLRADRNITPEDYELAGKEDVNGRPCYVVQSRAGHYRLHIGAADGRLYRRTVLVVREGKAGYSALATYQRVGGPSIKTINNWRPWVESLKPNERRRAWRELKVAEFPFARPWSSTTFDDYREVAPGCWLAFRQTTEMYELDSPEAFLAIHGENTVVEASVNRRLPNSLFHVELVDGVPVNTDWRYDPPIRYTYRKDQTEAERIALRDAERSKRAKVQAELKQRDSATVRRMGQVPLTLPKAVWLDGKPLSWAQLRGKVVVLHFWDVNCGPCMTELPFLAGWHEKSAETGVAIIGIHPPTNDLVAVRKKLAKFGAKYPVLIDSAAAKPGGIGAMHDWFGISMWPYTVLIDKNGKVAGHGQVWMGDIAEQARRLSVVDPSTPNHAAAGMADQSEHTPTGTGANVAAKANEPPAAPKANDPSGKTSIIKPAAEKKPAEALTYTGLVTDKLTGKPIAGATVTVLRRVYSRTEPFGKWLKLGQTKHQTDAKGEYTFTLPPEQVAEKQLYIEITVTYPNYARYYGGYSFDMICKNEKLGERPFFENVGLNPLEKISGTIVTPDGKPVAGVLVRAVSTPKKDDLNHAAWTNASSNKDGYFQINAVKGGEAVFWILPKDYAPSTHVAHAKRGDFGRFVLEKGLVLKGRVVDTDGKPLKNVWVNADIHGGPAKHRIDMPVFDFVARSALSDSKGDFAMAPLPAGDYDLIVADRPRGGSGDVHPLPAVFLNREITLDQDSAANPIEVRAVPYVLIKGQFFDGSGKPTSGYAPSLSAHNNDPGSRTSFWNTAQIDKHGKFNVRAPKGFMASLDIMDNEHHAIKTRVSRNARLCDGRTLNLGVLDHDMTEVAVIRYVAPILLVKAVGEDGNPVQNIQPRITYHFNGSGEGGQFLRDGEPAGYVSFERQDDGRYRTSQLLPDEEFTLTVEAEGYEPRSEKLKLPEGEVKELEVKLKPAAPKAKDQPGKTSAETPKRKRTTAAPISGPLQQVRSVYMTGWVPREQKQSIQFFAQRPGCYWLSVAAWCWSDYKAFTAVNGTEELLVSGDRKEAYLTTVSAIENELETERKLQNELPLELLRGDFSDWAKTGSETIRDATYDVYEQVRAFRNTKDVADTWKRRAWLDSKLRLPVKIATYRIDAVGKETPMQMMDHIEFNVEASATGLPFEPPKDYKVHRPRPAQDGNPLLSRIGSGMSNAETTLHVWQSFNIDDKAALLCWRCELKDCSAQKEPTFRLERGYHRPGSEPLLGVRPCDHLEIRTIRVADCHWNWSLVFPKKAGEPLGNDIVEMVYRPKEGDELNEAWLPLRLPEERLKVVLAELQRLAKTTATGSTEPFTLETLRKRLGNAR